jgi:hypothetical protein
MLNKHLAHSWRIDHHAYCGMTIPIADGLTYQEAKERMKRRMAFFIKHYGGEVMLLAGPSLNVVEFCEPETCDLIPDACGVARITKETTK